MSNPTVYKNFINGQWVESKSGAVTENRNPANTDEILGATMLSPLLMPPVKHTKNGV